MMAIYYETLDIPNDADEATIKKAYRKCYLQWHPDKNPHRREEAERRFKEIAEAQETLTDSVRKAAYDRYLSRGHDVAVQGSSTSASERIASGHRRSGSQTCGGIDFLYKHARLA